MPRFTRRSGQPARISAVRRPLASPRVVRRAGRDSFRAYGGESSGSARGQARPLRGLERARQGRDGRGVPRQGPRHRPARRDQDDQDLPGRRGRLRVPRVPGALRARGPDRRDPVAPQHRHDPRHRRGHGEPGVVHRHGVHRGAQPQVAPDRQEPVHLGRDRGPRRPDRRGSRLRPPQGHHPSRRQAGEHHSDDRRQGEDHRLRDREGRLVQSHDDGAVSRDTQLHVARAGLGGPRRRPERHLLARRRALRAPDLAQAFPGRQSHGDLLQDRARGLHAAGRTLDRRAP